MKRHLIVILINISLMIGDVVTFHITVGHLSPFFEKCPFYPCSYFCDNTGETGGHYAKEISQTHKDKYCVRSPINGI